MSDVVKGVCKEKVNTEASNLYLMGPIFCLCFHGYYLKFYLLSMLISIIVFIHGVFSIL